MCRAILFVHMLCRYVEILPNAGARIWRPTMRKHSLRTHHTMWIWAFTRPNELFLSYYRVCVVRVSVFLIHKCLATNQRQQTRAFNQHSVCVCVCETYGQPQHHTWRKTKTYSTLNNNHNSSMIEPSSSVYRETKMPNSSIQFAVVICVWNQWGTRTVKRIV